MNELDLARMYENPRASVGILQKLCERLAVGFLIPADLPSTLFLSEIRDRLLPVRTFPLSQPDLIRRLANKLTFASLLEELNLPQPRYVTFTPGKEIPQLPFGYPVVAKPPNLDAGQGVKVCHDAAELRAHLAALRDTGQMQIQEYVPGYDLDLTLLADGSVVRAWAIHKRSSDKLGAALPSCRFVENDELLEIGKRLVRATGFCGLAHIDGRFDERTNEVKLIECNPRAYDSIQFAAFAGVNFVTAGLHFGDDIAPERCTQENGVVNSPLGMLKLLIRRAEGIPIWTPGTRRAWTQLLRDPAPWAIDLSRVRALF